MNKLDQITMIQQLFNAWQDLAEAETGHDTEWSYPISIDRLAHALHINRDMLTVLLSTLTQPELELCLNETTFTFHQPPSDRTANLAGGKCYRAKASDLVQFKIFQSKDPIALAISISGR